MARLKLLILIAVSLLLVTPVIASASTLHSATYAWYSTGGTLVNETIPTPKTWSIGDTSGIAYVKIQEDVIDAAQAGPPPPGALPGSNRFIYTITALDSVGNGLPGDPTGGAGITDFHINDLVGVGAGSVQKGPTMAPFLWTNLDNPFVAPSWDWVMGLGGMPIGLGVAMVPILDSFEIWTPAPWGFVTGSVTSGGGPVASGVISGPVPEPATLLLLGFGFVGLAAYGWRKKKQSES